MLKQITILNDAIKAWQLKQSILGKSKGEMIMETNIDLSTIDWKRDRITREYVDENREKLSDPTLMESRELGEAITYCRIAWNPFADELMRRSGHLDEFQQARTDKERSKILDKSCRYHGFMLY